MTAQKHIQAYCLLSYGISQLVPNSPASPLLLTSTLCLRQLRLVMWERHGDTGLSSCRWATNGI